MVRKIFLCILFTLCCTFPVNAQDSTEPYFYNEYDDYYEMEQEYLDSVVDETVTPPNKITFSAPAIILGAAAGIGTAYIILNIAFAPPKPDPYFRKAEEKHEVTNKADEKSAE